MAFLKKVLNNQEEKTNSAGDSASLLGLSVFRDEDAKEAGYTQISVVAPSLKKKAKRQPVSLCCVVDTSGSMGCDAIIKDEQGKEESHGLSILDLVKHSIKTMIKCLDKHDSLSIISYSNEAQIITPLIKMSKGNKTKTLNALKELQADGQTNLWSGLMNGLEQLRKANNSTQTNSAVYLFTDGLPNVNPPKGHQAMLTDYLAQYSDLNVTINTYGFGYSLDTPLLTDLAIMGNGTYAFIPDSTMVGTIFVHAISNFCCNVAKDVSLNIACGQVDQSQVNVLGGYVVKKDQDNNTLRVMLGNVQYGQNRDIILQLPNDIQQISLSYTSLEDESRVNNQINMIHSDTLEVHEKRRILKTHMYRLQACDVLRKCMANAETLETAQEQLKQFIKQMQSDGLVKKETFVADLEKDLVGQCFEALAQEAAYNKWGKHYLPSLVFAHLNQMCNNFKDPGVQHYGGELFNQLRDQANDIFIKMPAPESSYKAPDWLKQFQEAGVRAAPVQRNVNMGYYMNAGGGCFHGECTITMHDGTQKLVQQLQPGDRVHQGARVLCVVQYACKDGNTMLTTMENGLRITPFHPIKINGEWIFPCEMSPTQQTTQMEACNTVYNLVLDAYHTVLVNGVECCSLGHDLHDNQVIEHAYFGTDKVIKDLQQCKGWNSGRVKLNQNAYIRDEKSGRICGLSIVV